MEFLSVGPFLWHFPTLRPATPGASEGSSQAQGSLWGPLVSRSLWDGLLLPPQWVLSLWTVQSCLFGHSSSLPLTAGQVCPWDQVNSTQEAKLNPDFQPQASPRSSLDFSFWRVSIMLCKVVLHLMQSFLDALPQRLEFWPLLDYRKITP